MVGAVAKMEENYAELSRHIRNLEAENPLAIRHLIDFRFPEALTVDPEEVDTAVGGHDLPYPLLRHELRLPGGNPLPHLRRGGPPPEYRLHERRGRRDRRHARPLPKKSRPADRLRALRRSHGPAQLRRLPGNQDRPGGQARRGRAPARLQGDGEDRRRPQRRPREWASSPPPTTTTSTPSRTSPRSSRSCAPPTRRRASR